MDAVLTSIKGMRICTPFTVSQNAKCGISAARQIIAVALSQGIIKPVNTSRSVKLYTSTSVSAKQAGVEEPQKKEQGKGKK